MSYDLPLRAVYPCEQSFKINIIMRNRHFIGTLLLCGGLLASLSSCGDDENIIIEPSPTQAEVNIQKLESFTQPVDYYVFVSPAMDLGGIKVEGYAIESPYLVVGGWGDSIFRFDMNKLIAFEHDQAAKTLTLYFP